MRDEISVYKNLFNQAKYVEEYTVNEMESQLSLTRHHLILMAYLTGSDYSEGVTGIGPVTALEILQEFGCSLQGLIDFKQWWLLIRQGHETHEEHESIGKKRFRKQVFKWDLPVCSVFNCNRMIFLINASWKLI